jgi:hypothetical protein
MIYLDDIKCEGDLFCIEDIPNIRALDIGYPWSPFPDLIISWEGTLQIKRAGAMHDSEFNILHWNFNRIIKISYAQTRMIKKLIKTPGWGAELLYKTEQMEHYCGLESRIYAGSARSTEMKHKDFPRHNLSTIAFCNSNLSPGAMTDSSTPSAPFDTDTSIDRIYPDIDTSGSDMKRYGVTVKADV